MPSITTLRIRAMRHVHHCVVAVLQMTESNGGQIMQQDKRGQGFEREATTRHEAGHAVISLHYGLPIESVDIRRQGGGDLGACQGVLPPDAVMQEMEALHTARKAGHSVDDNAISTVTREWMENFIRSTQAGPLAEEQFRGRKLPLDDVGKVTDEAAVYFTASTRWSTADRLRRVPELSDEVAKLLMQPTVAMAVKTVAQAMLEREHLSGDEVSELYRAAMGRVHTR